MRLKTRGSELIKILLPSTLHLVTASLILGLQKGPVFLEIGAPRCSDCQTMKSILNQVVVDYGDKITVISINISKSPKLAKYFGAHVVPVSFVIIDIKNGNYTYMQEDGNVSTNVSKAKIVGLRNKGMFTKVLNTALQQKNKSK